MYIDRRVLQKTGFTTSIRKSAQISKGNPPFSGCTNQWPTNLEATLSIQGDCLPALNIIC
jgi:hypothetical protein